MSDYQKPEFPPLLRSGFHLMDLAQLESICVAPFTTSSTRQRLLDILRSAIAEITQLGIICDLWLDGSFATKKIDPADIDLVTILRGQDVDGDFSSEQVAFLDQFINQDLRSLGLDTYGVPVYPVDTPEHVISEENLAYWRNWFGFARDGITAKGIIVVKINGGVQ